MEMYGSAKFNNLLSSFSHGAFWKTNCTETPFNYGLFHGIQFVYNIKHHTLSQSERGSSAGYVMEAFWSICFSSAEIKVSGPALGPP